MARVHDATCYQTVGNEELIHEYGYHMEEWGVAPPTDMNRRIAHAVSSYFWNQMAQRYNLPSWGCAVHCTCRGAEANGG